MEDCCNPKYKRKRMFFYLIGFILVFLLVYSLSFSSEIKLVDSNEFETIISSGAYVINAHTPYVGEIKGTDLNAEEWENMASYQDQLPKDKDTPIAIYCRSGRMSAISAQQLTDLGYTNIYDLEGGMNAWQSSGRNLVDSQVEETGETKEFDILPDYDEGVPIDYMPSELEEQWRDPKKLHQRYRDYWWNQVPEANRSSYIELRVIPYGRIIAIDDIGDKYYRRPHLLVEYETNGQPFKSHARRQFIESFRRINDILDVTEGKRISFFPKDIPEITLDKES